MAERLIGRTIDRMLKVERLLFSSDLLIEPYHSTNEWPVAGQTCSEHVRICRGKTPRTGVPFTVNGSLPSATHYGYDRGSRLGRLSFCRFANDMPLIGIQKRHKINSIKLSPGNSVVDYVKTIDSGFQHSIKTASILFDVTANRAAKTSRRSNNYEL